MVQISSGGFLPLSIWTSYFRLDQDLYVLMKDQTLDIATQEERESTQRGLAAKRRRNPLY
jgi:hypothetical protein